MSGGPIPERTEPITFAPDLARGYRRSPELQATFDTAAATLLAEDGWPDPQRGGERQLVADLALEGGGVKGIGLVGAVLVLDEAGYSIRGVAGTSAGAIAASIVAALSQSGHPMTELRQAVGSMQFANFMPEGRLHHVLGHLGGHMAIGPDLRILTKRMGMYPGDYLKEWLTPILSGLGVTTFGNLRITGDPELSLPAGHDYRLVVHTSDVTRGQLVRLPWDYPRYGYQPDDQEVVAAVRASMSIPFFFEPVTFAARATDVDVPTPDGRSICQHYAGGTVTWVDGGMLRNFPITAFDRVDGTPPRWPTIGIKLSSLQTEFPATQACANTEALGTHCLHTMMNEWDAYTVDDATAARTIFVDHGGLSATDFELTTEQQTMLFLNGVRAATGFVVEMAAAHGVPRTAEQATSLLLGRRRAGAGEAAGSG